MLSPRDAGREQHHDRRSGCEERTEALSQRPQANLRAGQKTPEKSSVELARRARNDLDDIRNRAEEHFVHDDTYGGVRLHAASRHTARCKASSDFGPFASNVPDSP